MFAITYKEIQCKFAGSNKITDKASLILKDANLFFENLDLQGGCLTCRNQMKIPEAPISFVPAQQGDAEIYCIRGYKPVK